jgi:hypothetical protein
MFRLPPLRRSAVAAGLVVACAGAACADRETRLAEPITPVRPALEASVSAGTVLDCPPGPAIKKHTGVSGHSADLNKNGVVCERQSGVPGPASMQTPSVFTDDIVLPAPVQPVAP